MKLMKGCYLMVLLALFSNSIKAQSFHFISNPELSVPEKKLFFSKYISKPLTADAVNSELESLSGFFYIHPVCYYYDTLSVSVKDPIEPDFNTDNVFVNVNLLKDNAEAENMNLITILAHQYAGLVTKKYKLSLSYEQKILFADYVTGYYLSCKLFNLKSKKTITPIPANYLNIDITDSDVLTQENRVAFMQQGIDDFLTNYRRRRICTLQDIIQNGLSYVRE